MTGRSRNRNDDPGPPQEDRRTGPAAGTSDREARSRNALPEPLIRPARPTSHDRYVSSCSRRRRAISRTHSSSPDPART